MKIIAFVGMPGSGKSLACSFLKEQGAVIFRFGDLTDEELKKRNLPRTEENEKKIREELRANFGMQVYADYISKKIKSLEKKLELIGLDGMRSFEEYLLLKKEFGCDFSAIALLSSAETRHSRLQTRNERPLTEEQCISRDEAELKKLNHGSTIAMSDYFLINENLGKDKFKSEIETIIKKFQKKPKNIA